MSGPVEKTAAELEAIIADQISKIVSSGIHSVAPDRRDGRIGFSEIEANLHLYERLGTAYEALRALRGYTGEPRGFRVIR